MAQRMTVQSPDVWVVENCPSQPMTPHPLSNIFPLRVEDESFWELVEDVRLNGVLEPIVMFEGMILDGRHRYYAAREVGCDYPIRQYTGSDPAAYVISANLHRRHLTASERAMIAARMATLPRGSNQHRQICLTSQDQAAKMLNVSPRSVRDSRRVLEKGAPSLIAAVEAGQLKVSTAAKITPLSQIAQDTLVEGGPLAVKQASAAMRAVSSKQATTSPHARPTVAEPATNEHEIARPTPSRPAGIERSLTVEVDDYDDRSFAANSPVARVRKNGTQEVRFHLLSQGSRSFVDIRVFTHGMDGNSATPTKKGFQLDVTRISELLDAVMTTDAAFLKIKSGRRRRG